MQTIEPDIQEAILDILPDDGLLAIRLMCQLLANMIISIRADNIDDVINHIRAELVSYEGT